MRNALDCVAIKALNYITHILNSLHWLKIDERIFNKLISITYILQTYVYSSSKDFNHFSAPTVTLAPSSMINMLLFNSH